MELERQERLSKLQLDIAIFGRFLSQAELAPEKKGGIQVEALVKDIIRDQHQN